MFYSNELVDDYILRMAHTDRTILLRYKDEKSGIEFRLERWFIAADHKSESIIKPALVWDNGDNGAHVVLLGTDEVRAVIGELMPFA